MTTYQEAAGLFGAPAPEAAAGATAPAAYFDPAEAMQAWHDARNGLRMHLTLSETRLDDRPDITAIRQSVGAAALAFEHVPGATPPKNPAHTVARLHIHAALAEAVMPDGSPLKALPHILKGIIQLEAARTEPLAQANRKPVSGRHFAAASLIVGSHIIPGQRIQSWRNNRATELTNYR